MRLLWLGFKIPTTLTGVGMSQFTTTMAYDNLKYTDIYNSHANICRSVIVRRTKYQTLWKGLYVNHYGIFYAEDFVGKIGIILLLNLQIFFVTMPQEVRKPANKWKTEGQNVHSSWL